MKPKIVTLLVLMAWFGYSTEVPAKEGFIERSGDIIQLGLPVYAGLHSLSQKDTSGLLQLTGVVATQSVATWGLKETINRKRPNGGKHSFPSGHTAVSFAAATYLAKRNGAAYGIPAYVLASYVGYSRIQAKKHWVSDVLAGAGIGVASGLIFTKEFKNGVTLSPYASPEGGGLSVSKSF